MDRFAILFLTSLGVGCLCAGYKLFCGLPALSGKTTRASRAGVVLLNVIPGILLALLGTGLLTAEVHGILAQQPGIHRRQPSAEGTSWHLHKPGLTYHNRTA